MVGRRVAGEPAHEEVLESILAGAQRGSLPDSLQAGDSVTGRGAPLAARPRIVPRL